MVRRLYPTEGAGAGAFIGLMLAIIKGARLRDIIDGILSVGRTSAPILLLLVTAALYSRTLAMTGMANAIEGFLSAPAWRRGCHYRDGFDLVCPRHDHRLDFNYVANGGDLCAYCSKAWD